MAKEGPRTNRLYSGNPGNGLTTNTFKVLKGETFSLSINHVGTSHSTGKPDYDYVAEVLYPSNAPVMILLDYPGTNSVLGAYSTPGYQDPVFFAEGKTATVHIVKIKTENVATAPLDRARRTIGVGEEVQCTMIPSIPANWGTTAGYVSYFLGTDSIKFTAPEFATNTTVTARYNGQTLAVDFTVLAPTNYIAPLVIPHITERG